jgi:hypothetical protein
MARKYYWTTKKGKKIDVDKMDINHLRNTLKYIIRSREDDKKRGDEPEPYAFDYLWK